MLTAMVGCVNRPPPTVWTTRPQLAQYTERALAAVRSKEAIRLPDASFGAVVGDYDPTKSIQYVFQAGKPSKVIVQIPTKTSTGESFAVFEFDAYSGVILDVSHLNVYP
jgi:hypothetical protein